MTDWRLEIEHWLGGGTVDVGIETLVESFARVEGILGRGWLDERLKSGTVGPAIALPVHLVGEGLSVLDNAKRKERLIKRLRAEDRAAFSELHSLALCGKEEGIEIEIEPEIDVQGVGRMPDFRLRKNDFGWIYVEITEPNHSESAIAAQKAARSLHGVLEKLPDNIMAHVRFRDEPTHDDIAEVTEVILENGVGAVVDKARFIVHLLLAQPEFSPIGRDEHGRPIMGSMIGRLSGTNRAGIAVRVPFTDERGQDIIDAEARQLPQEGPGLICVKTRYGKSWSLIIERSFSPNIRRRISAVLLFESGIVLGERGYRLATSARLLVNPHARSPLPAWLQQRLEQLPRSLEA